MFFFAVLEKNWEANTYIRLRVTACGVFTTIIFHFHSLHGGVSLASPLNFRLPMVVTGNPCGGLKA